jgi:hypothetical protein
MTSTHGQSLLECDSTVLAGDALRYVWWRTWYALGCIVQAGVGWHCVMLSKEHCSSVAARTLVLAPLQTPKVNRSPGGCGGVRIPGAAWLSGTERSWQCPAFAAHDIAASFGKKPRLLAELPPGLSASCIPSFEPPTRTSTSYYCTPLASAPQPVCAASAALHCALPADRPPAALAAPTATRRPTLR